MIHTIKGQLLDKMPPSAIIEVQGLGYEVLTPMTTFYQLPDVGQTVQLLTHFVVREDAHILYGFADALSRAVFRCLIKVNGVGPKLALAILSGMEADSLYRCVENEETMRLTRLPGVGKKTAERLIVELRDKLPAVFRPLTPPTEPSLATTVTAPTTASLEEAVSALIALGYKPQEASRAVQAVQTEGGQSSAELIRQALQAMVA